MTLDELYTCDEAAFAEHFAKTICEAEKIRRGGIFDARGTLPQRHAAYARGVMLARLRMITPPIQSGAQVKISVSASSILTPLEKSDTSCALRASRVYEVSRVWFEDTNTWSVSLKGMESMRYPLSYFDVVPACDQLQLAG